MVKYLFIATFDLLIDTGQNDIAGHAPILFIQNDIEWTWGYTSICVTNSYSLDDYVFQNEDAWLCALEWRCMIMCFRSC